MELIGNIMGGLSVILTLVFGIYLSVKSRFFQFKGLKNALKQVFCSLFSKKSDAVHSKGAVCTSLAATIGTGNIVGVSGAIALGGAGVVFWMATSSVLAMIIKYVEIYTVVDSRKLVDGEYRGGAMYAAEKHLKKLILPIGTAFAFLIAVASFGTGNLIQMNTAAQAVNDVLKEFSLPSDELSLGLCVFCAFLVGFLLLSGVGAVARFCEKLMPFMLVFYTLSGVLVIVLNYQSLLEVITLIIKGAFNPRAVTGGAVVSVFLAVKTGIVRGIVSNEAGMGSAAIAHSAASTDAKLEGELGIAEVFIDTVISLLTAFVILLGNKDIVYGKDTGLLSVLDAFKNSFGNLAGLILAMFLIIFGVSSVLGWGAFGTVCAEFLWHKKGGFIYKILFSLSCVLGAVISVEKIWIISEILNSLVFIPNIIIVYLLFKKLFSQNNIFQFEKDIDSK